MAWTDDRVAQLVELVGGEGTEVTQDMVASAAETLEVSARSVGSKLRKMGYEVEKATAKARSFSEAQEDELRSFLASNSGSFTYGEIASQVCGGEFSAKQIQGKVLSLEMTGHVKPTPKAESTKTYSDAEEAQIISMVANGDFLEDIAAALGREVNSIRGKCLSLLRTENIDSFPAQKNYAEKAADPFDGLNIAEMTVAEIAEQIGKSERGVKVMLTRRDISAADYKSKKKAD
jgi:hypothetical protein